MYISNFSYATEFATMAVSPFAEVLCFSAPTARTIDANRDNPLYNLSLKIFVVASFFVNDT